MSSFRVEWERGEVGVRLVGSGTPILLAHGAGTNHDHPMITGLASALAGEGLAAVTFNYPYTEAGRRAPDRMPVLMECHRSVAGWARTELGELVFAGRSMGGRVASMLAAEGEPMRGLVLYSYPLHPSGKPDRLRAEHLPAIEVPMLFFQGGRDALARSELFDRHVRPLTGATVVDLEGLDHSWRGGGHTYADVVPGVASATAAWIRHLASGGVSQA
ncbi:MAG: dienelactone hydrolase [Acidimicrobiia bacterium]|nr:dienelactone hydrolase [Acidimicrobiia bacterium]MDH4307131.1 dienelactone hydrolase [Acidimicrobiia bacterium]